MSDEEMFPHNLFMFERQDNLYWIDDKWQYPPIYYNGAYYLGGSIKDCPVMKPFSYEETTYAMDELIIFDGEKWQLQ